MCPVAIDLSTLGHNFFMETITMFLDSSLWGDFQKTQDTIQKIKNKQQQQPKKDIANCKEPY